MPSGLAQGVRAGFLFIATFTNEMKGAPLPGITEREFRHQDVSEAAWLRQSRVHPQQSFSLLQRRDSGTRMASQCERGPQTALRVDRLREPTSQFLPCVATPGLTFPSENVCVLRLNRPWKGK